MRGLSCFFCGGTGKLFNVYQIYGSHKNNTIRDDLVEFLGIEVEIYLTEGDMVCNLCMNMFDNIAKLKKFLWAIILNPQYKTRKFMNKFLNHFAAFKIEDADVVLYDSKTTHRTSTPVTTVSNRSPSDLVTCHYFRPYEEVVEKGIAENERARREMQKRRSKSRSSSKTRSDGEASANEEVEAIFSRRPKKRGHKWTRVKGSNSRNRETTTRQTKSVDLVSLARSRAAKQRLVQSEMARPVSSMSDASFLSEYTVDREEERVVSQPKRTRSVTKMLEKEAKETFACDEPDCVIICNDVDLLTEHKLFYHNHLALYFCDECDSRYTTKEHLNVHQKLHDRTPLICIICGLPLPTRETLKCHIDEHMEYSVSCPYCDLSFLSKRLCEQHSRYVHRGKKQRKMYRKQLILERIDNPKTRPNSNVSNSSSSEVSGTPSKEHEMRVLILNQSDNDVLTDMDDYESDDSFYTRRLSNVPTVDNSYFDDGEENLLQTMVEEDRRARESFMYQILGEGDTFEDEQTYQQSDEDDRLSSDSIEIHENTLIPNLSPELIIRITPLNIGAYVIQPSVANLEDESGDDSIT